jgi:hypothetical protein
MFRGGRDWPVACNEIPNLMLHSLESVASVALPAQACFVRSAPGGRPKRRLNARLKELSDW